MQPEGAERVRYFQPAFPACLHAAQNFGEIRRLLTRNIPCRNIFSRKTPFSEVSKLNHQCRKRTWPLDRNVTRSYTKILSIVLNTSLVVLLTSAICVEAQTGRKTVTRKTIRALSVKEIARLVLQSLVVVTAKDVDGKVIGQGSGFFLNVERPPADPELRKFTELEIKWALDSAKNAGASRIELVNIQKYLKVIVTNLHVVKWATKIEIREIRSGIVYDVSSARGLDLNNDLCLLSLGDFNQHIGVPLEIADSDRVGVGDSVIVAGNPKGLEGSISRGIVSAIRNTDKLIQIDASVSAGSSGGPVINESGKVIGVVVGMMLGGQNLNFIIPSNIIRQVSLTSSLSGKALGAIAVSSRERDKLLGSVRKVHIARTELYAAIDSTTGRVLRQIERRLSEQVTEYNLRGQQQSFSSYFNGVLKFRYRYTFGKLGCVIRTVMTDESGNETVENFDENVCLRKNLLGDSFSSQITVEPEPGIKVVFKYDRFGNEIVYIQEEKGVVTSTFSTYDNGLLISQRHLVNGRQTETRRFTYDLDTFGNWIRQVQTTYSSEWPDVGAISKITTRTIEYFEK